MKKLLLLLCLSLIMCGCQNSDNETNTDETVSNNTDTSDIFTKRDLNSEYSKDECIMINLSQDHSSSDDSVSIKDNTITITKEADYYVTGSLTDGMIIVDSSSDAKIRLIFDNVSIHSETSAALYVKQADKVVVTCVGDSTLTNGGSFVAIDDNNIDGTVFSKDDLTFNGSGSISVESSAGHGIVAKDDLVFTGGTYNIVCASHGLRANDSIRIKDSSFNIDSGKDGMQASHDEDETLGYIYIDSATATIECEGDGISASSYITINDIDCDIVSGGGYVNGEVKTSSQWGGFGGHGPHGQSSNTSSDSEDSESIKGIKCTKDLMIYNGTFTIDSADDSLHSNGNVYIYNGQYKLLSGDDGVHADNELIIYNGDIEVGTSYEGLEGLSVDIRDGNITLEASDDGINSAGGTDQSGTGGHRGGDRFGGGSSASSDAYIKISGGSIYIHGGGDCIDSNGSLEISGGKTIVSGETQGDTSILDFESQGTITGGTFIGLGASMMAQTFTSNENQGTIAVTVGSQGANVDISFIDSKGNTVFEYTSERAFNCMIISTPDINSGDSYTVNVGELSGTIQAN